MFDIELLLGLSSSHISPPSTHDNSYTNQSAESILIQQATYEKEKHLHFLQKEIERLNNLNKFHEPQTPSASHEWQPTLQEESFSIAPANSPNLSPTRKRNHAPSNVNATAIAVASLQSMRSAQVDGNFQPRVLFAEEESTHAESFQSNDLVIASDIMKRTPFDKDHTSNIIDKSTNPSFIFGSSPPTSAKLRNQSINRSFITQNYTHQTAENFQSTTSFEYTFNDSCVPNTTLLDTTLIEPSYDYQDPTKIKEGNQRSDSPEKRPEDITVDLTQSYGFDDIHYLGKFPLSSSPVPRFESRFPEPKLIAELFGIDETDISKTPTKKSLRTAEVNVIKSHSPIKKTKSYIDTEKPQSSYGAITDTHVSRLSQELSYSPNKSPAIYSELLQRSKSRTQTLYDAHYQRDSSLRTKVQGKKKKSFRLEVDPVNIIAPGSGYRRVLRDTTTSKYKESDNEDDRISASDETELWDYSKQNSSHEKDISKREVISRHRRRPSKQNSTVPRSKNGCWTCRIRKKKCSEEKPICSQCAHLEITCDGYSVNKPKFMESNASQRKRLDEIKAHTTLRKKIGIARSLKKTDEETE